MLDDLTKPESPLVDAACRRTVLGCGDHGVDALAGASVQAVDPAWT